MNQLNSLIIEGNIAADATIKEQAPGFKVCNYTVGVNRFYKNRNGEEVNEVSYFDCKSYGPLADYDFEKAKKGVRMRLVGRLKQEPYTDENGKTFSKIYIVVEHTEYYGKQTSENPIEDKTEDCQF